MVREAPHGSRVTSRVERSSGPRLTHRGGSGARSARRGPYARGVQRWSWTVIECSWGAWAILWAAMAFSAKRTVERPSGAWVRTTGLSVGVVYLVLRAIAGPSWHRQLAATPRAVQVLAVALVIVGLGFCAWARVTLGGNWSGAVAFKLDHELIQSGPYGLVRHPIYTGLLTMVLGTALDYLSIFSFASLGLLTAVFLIKSRVEERLMVEHFPDAYPSYRARVKALIPFVV